MYMLLNKTTSQSVPDTSSTRKRLAEPGLTGLAGAVRLVAALVGLALDLGEAVVAVRGLENLSETSQ